MTQVSTEPDTQKISQKGRELFAFLDRELRPEYRGWFVAIEVESGECFLGKTVMEANQRARAKHPGKVCFLGKIGYPAAFAFKGRR